jgi:hypothetical protein
MERTSLAGCNVTVFMRSVDRRVLSNKVDQIAALPALLSMIGGRASEACAARTTTISSAGSVPWRR